MQLLIDKANEKLKKPITQTSSFDLVIDGFDTSCEGCQYGCDMFKMCNNCRRNQFIEDNYTSQK